MQKFIMFVFYRKRVVVMMILSPFRKMLPICCSDDVCRHVLVWWGFVGRGSLDRRQSFAWVEEEGGLLCDHQESQWGS